METRYLGHLAPAPGARSWGWSRERAARPAVPRTPAPRRL